jgi:formate dehydrogenase subunit gamma
LSGKHVPSHRFNAGEKIWFWGGVTVLGLVVSASGWVLDMIVPIPGIEYWRGTMQLAHIIHAAAAILMTVMAMGHIYVGSIGMEGALQGMKTGYVDEAWGKEHHELWYDDMKSGKIKS